MSGFSAEWLTLREPLDHAARDKSLLRQAIRVLPQSGGHVLDLGAGTGSTFRAFASAGGGRHRWRLIDNDPGLLDQARKLCGPDVEVEEADLGQLGRVSFDGIHLVTASALLDLCSEAWVRQLAHRVVRAGAAFYAALTYDGDIHWRPQDANDPLMVEAFNRHQQTDKGMGRALGPDAGRRTEKIFSSLGYSTRRALSPWRMGPGTQAVHAAFVDGIAEALLESATLHRTTVDNWIQDRTILHAGGTCVVGHVDLLAMPPPAEG
jgi:SAM-dependent methyltransferase